MANNYNSYQYGTSPKKIQSEYSAKRKKIEKTVKVEEKNKNNKTLNQKQRAIKYLAIGFAILFVISYRNSLINESFSKKEKLKSDLGAIQKTNEQLQVAIENSLNLKNVEQAAKEKLGMQKPTNSQKIYITLPKKDYIQPATEEVIVNEEVSWIKKIIEGFTKTIK